MLTHYCPIEMAAEIVAERWNLLIIRDLMGPGRGPDDRRRLDRVHRRHRQHRGQHRAAHARAGVRRRREVVGSAAELLDAGPCRSFGKGLIVEERPAGATVDAAARLSIQQALQHESDHYRALPDPLPLGRVLRLVDETAGSSEVTVIVACSDERGYYVDFYRRENDDTTSWHGRVRDDGSRESLENIEGQFGIRASADPEETRRERARVHAHNAHVLEVLRRKGFRSA